MHMLNTIFHNKEFEIKGIRVPAFRLQPGKLIRVYVPNHDAQSNPLGHNFCITLIKRFKKQNPDLHWVKDYSARRIFSFLPSPTVEKYLTRKLHIPPKKAYEIMELLEIDSHKKMDHLILGKRKALIMKAVFQKAESILFDYYGVGAAEIDLLEKTINEEIENGKAAIGFDRLEYAVEKEPYENIEPVNVIVPNHPLT